MRRELLQAVFVLGIAAAACANVTTTRPDASNAQAASTASTAAQPLTATPSGAQKTAAHPIELGADLQVRELEPGVWLHVSSKELPEWGRVPSNGLVVVGRESALLIDTPWTPEQTERLLAWLRESQKLTSLDVIVTHFHEDRLGGISALPASARIHALGATSRLAAQQGNTFAATELQPETSLKLAGESVETYFPGAGHTHDNIVVWLPERRILYGGCFVKSAHSQDLGNVADADITSWRASVQRVIERYPGAAVVIPGHGDSGGTELLVHTRDLVDAALEPQPARP